MFTETFTYNTWNTTSSWLTAHSSQQVSMMYDPYTSMFLSPDNYIQAPDNSQSFNRYAYCLNNPLKYTDPSGEFWHIIAGAALEEYPIWRLIGIIVTVGKTMFRILR